MVSFSHEAVRAHPERSARAVRPERTGGVARTSQRALNRNVGGRGGVCLRAIFRRPTIEEGVERTVSNQSTARGGGGAAEKERGSR